MSPVLIPDKKQHRIPRQRAFTGLVGRDAPEDFPEKLPDPPLPNFDPEKDYADAIVRFQEYAFDPALKGADPNADEHGNMRIVRKPNGASSRVGDPDEQGNLGKILAKTTGHHVTTVRQEPGKRTRIPWWISSGKAFEEFLLRLINEDVPEDEYKVLKPRELRDAAGLDFNILYEFYIGGREDYEIFDTHVEEFKREAGRQRITSSVAAVTKRRQRSVEKGSQMFGKEARPVEGPEHREHRAHWATIRLGPAMKSRREQKS